MGTQYVQEALILIYTYSQCKGRKIIIHIPPAATISLFDVFICVFDSALSFSWKPSAGRFLLEVELPREYPVILHTYGGFHPRQKI